MGLFSDRQELNPQEQEAPASLFSVCRLYMKLPHRAKNSTDSFLICSPYHNDSNAQHDDGGTKLTVTCLQHVCYIAMKATSGMA